MKILLDTNIVLDVLLHRKQSLLKVFGIAAIDSDVLHNALRIGSPDFEDAVTAVAAQKAGCSFVVTRDPKGFRGSPVPCITPEAVFALTQR